MKRRIVLSGTLFGSAYITARALGSTAGAPPLKADRYLSQMGDSLQDVMVVGEMIYSLIRRSTDRLSFVVAHSTAGAGQLLWQHALPQAMYLSTGVHTDGSLLIHAIGYLKTTAHHLLKLNSTTGEITVFAEIPAGRRLFRAGSGRFIRINASGDLEKLDFAESRPTLRHIGVLAASFASAVHVQPIEESLLVAIVDQRTGAAVRVDIDSGEIETLDMASPELATSLAFYEPMVRDHAGDKPPLNPQVITAIGANGPRRVSMLLSPYKGDGTANILSFSDTGSDLIATQITLPHRMSVGNPFKLGRIHNQFAVMFSGGSYVLYDI